MGRVLSSDRAGRPSGWTILAVALIALALLSGRAHAAPVLPAEGEDALAGWCALGAVPAAECIGPAGLPLAQPLEMVEPGLPTIFTPRSLLGSAALDYADVVAPIPLPAAAWLILAGIGALGIAGRRRSGALPTLRPRRATGRTGPAAAPGLEPIAGTLHGTALSDTQRFFGILPRRRSRSANAAETLRRLRALCAPRFPAFPPGTSSTAVPCGGSTARHSPLAERAPPAAVGAPAAMAGSVPKAFGSPHSPRARSPRAAASSFSHHLRLSLRGHGARGRGVGRNGKNGSNPRFELRRLQCSGCSFATFEG